MSISSTHLSSKCFTNSFQYSMHVDMYSADWGHHGGGRQNTPWGKIWIFFKAGWNHQCFPVGNETDFQTSGLPLSGCLRSQLRFFFTIFSGTSQIPSLSCGLVVYSWTLPSILSLNWTLVSKIFQRGKFRDQLDARAIWNFFDTGVHWVEDWGLVVSIVRDLVDTTVH